MTDIDMGVNCIAYIALGSNVGDRSAALMSAVLRMDEIDGIDVRRLSQMIETLPLGGPAGQGMYVNAVAEIATHLPPLELLEVLQGIEAELGRDRSGEVRWGPRTCDLDIVLMGDLIMETDALTIPHPRMHERFFVLRPLVEIAPGAIHPKLGKTAVELLSDLEASG